MAEEQASPPTIPADVGRRAMEAFAPFVNCSFTYFSGKVLGSDSKLMREDVERARAAITELQQALAAPSGGQRE